MIRDRALALVQKYLPDAGKAAGSELALHCPFHDDKFKRKFSINLDKGLFRCWTAGCPANSGGDLEKLLKMLNVPEGVIRQELEPIQKDLDENRKKIQFDRQHLFESSDPFRARNTLPEALLGIFHYCPKMLTDRGFDASLLEKMEVGFDPRLGRITYPLRDSYGTLAGIAGGAIVPQQLPKYLVYEGGRKLPNGQWKPGDFGEWFDEDQPGYRCENHDFLWNYHQAGPAALAAPHGQDLLYVVEGFKACIWMIQCGFTNTVALMGSSLTEMQKNLLARHTGVVLCLDNDDAGEKGTVTVGNKLFKPLHGRVWSIRYPEADLEDETQPDDYPREHIRQIVESAIPHRVQRTHPSSSS